MKKLRFTLKRTDIKFSDRQKMYIEFHIDSEKNWKNFKDLIDIKMDNMGNDFFDVIVNDTGTKWHSSFSRVLCQKADLNNLKIPLSDSGDGLFDVDIL